MDWKKPSCLHKVTSSPSHLCPAILNLSLDFLCPVLSCPVLSCLVLSCAFLCFPVLSCPLLSCLVLSCPVLSCLVPHCRLGHVHHLLLVDMTDIHSTDSLRCDVLPTFPVSIPAHQTKLQYTALHILTLLFKHKDKDIYIDATHMYTHMHITVAE